MDARSYLKASAVNLAFLVAGGIMWQLILTTQNISIVVVHAQGDKTPPRATTKLDEPKSPGCDESKYECVSVGISSGAAAFGTLLANRIASDQLMVNGFDPLKLHDATLSTLQRKGLLSSTEVEQIVEAGRVKRPLRLKNPPQ